MGSEGILCILSLRDSRSEELVLQCLIRSSVRLLGIYDLPTYSIDLTSGLGLWALSQIDQRT